MSLYKCPNCGGVFVGGHYCVGNTHGKKYSYLSANTFSLDEEKMTNPEFDEHGYPTEKTLERIKKWEYSDGWFELMQFVSRAWYWPEYCTFTDALNYWNKPVVRCRLVTGGWSGNEDIITALEGNFIFWNMCWQESHRGGKHIFEVKKEVGE